MISGALASPLVATAAQEVLLFLLEGLLNEVAQPEVGQMREQVSAILYSASKRAIYLFTEHIAGWYLPWMNKRGPGSYE